MGRPALAQARATPVPPAKAHLQSLCSWRSESRSQATEIVKEVSVRPTLSSPSSDPGQSGEENGWHRWSEICPPSRKTGLSWSHSPETERQEKTEAAQTCLDTQARKSRAKTTRNTREGR